MNLVEREATVRVFFDGEYQDTIKCYIGIPENFTDDNEIQLMMDEIYTHMKDEYGDYTHWDEGLVSWTLHSWEDL